jgi:DNA-binding NarL/FixJ family response regulator
VTSALDEDRTVLRVAVTDPFPLFRHGVRMALAEAGFDAESPTDLLTWARIDEPRLLLFTVRTAQDWDLLPELCQARAGTAVIAVLEDASVPASVRALNAGAAGILPRDATLPTMREVVGAAARGDSLVPTSVLRALTERQPTGEPATAAGRPSTAEREWLSLLARGDNVATVAARAGYSERMMFRLLRDLYTKIGAANRTEAMIRARDQGWI